MFVAPPKYHFSSETRTTQGRVLSIVPPYGIGGSAPEKACERSGIGIVRAELCGLRPLEMLWIVYWSVARVVVV